MEDDTKREVWGVAWSYGMWKLESIDGRAIESTIQHAASWVEELKRRFGSEVFFFSVWFRLQIQYVLSIPAFPRRTPPNCQPRCTSLHRWRPLGFGLLRWILHRYLVFSFFRVQLVASRWQAYASSFRQFPITASCFQFLYNRRSVTRHLSSYSTRCVANSLLYLFVDFYSCGSFYALCGSDGGRHDRGSYHPVRSITRPWNITTDSVDDQCSETESLTFANGT